MAYSAIVREPNKQLVVAQWTVRSQQTLLLSYLEYHRALDLFLAYSCP